MRQSLKLFLPWHPITGQRWYSVVSRCAYAEEAAERRSKLFSQEKQRQIDLIKRVEKIKVNYCGIPEDGTLYMNKDLSTPFNVAQHMSEALVERSALAIVDGKPWDMHRPLEGDCEVQLRSFHDLDPFHVNKAFWRSCSFLLGYACESVFGENIPITLHSFPPPNVNSGSFVYDIDLGSKDWSPSKEELMVISARMHRIAEESLPFERLVVDLELAKDMFSDSIHKKRQIPSIARNSYSGTSVTLYRVKNHVDISSGPMVANSNFLGRRCTIAAAHKIDSDGVPLYRFQGVALPNGIFLNHQAFGILEKRAAKLNETNTLSAQRVTPS